MPDYELYIASFKWVYFFGIALMFLSLPIFEAVKNKRIAVLILFSGVLIFNLFFAFSDPFLYLWDEQFHALVAKNMLKNPFYPYLLDGNQLDVASTSWTRNNIWLHKQPFFLWLIALSFKIFGSTYWALRLPSTILSAMMILPIYGIGKIAINKRVGYWAALFFAASTTFVPMLTGRVNTDHNDAIFGAMVLFSIYYYFKYLESPKLKFIILLGIFAGFAFLTKWAIGILVFSGWGLNVLIFKENRIKIKSYFDLAIGFLVMTCVALPWQLYSYFRFREIFLEEFMLNGAHFTNSIEGHRGPWNYYLEHLNQTIFSTASWYFVIIIVLFIINGMGAKLKPRIALLTYIVLVYLFFSISATKMPFFTQPVFPLIMVVLAIVLHKIADWLLKLQIRKHKIPLSAQKLVWVLIPFFVSVRIFNQDEFLMKPEWRKDIWHNQLIENQIYKDVAKTINYPDKTMVFNFPYVGNVRFIFETGIDARDFIPSQSDIQELKRKHIQIYVFDHGQLPDYILDDHKIVKIESKLWSDGIKQNGFVLYW